jgi:hypothetical protein
MKKLILMLGVILLCVTVNAQYSKNKKLYNHHDYVYQPSDPVPPAIAGLSSLFVPGMGQLISDETIRGLAFMSAYAVVFSAYIIDYSESFNRVNARGNNYILLAAGCINVLSIIDAVRVTKVNNMAYRDKGTSLRMQPYYDGEFSGLSFKIPL